MKKKSVNNQEINRLISGFKSFRSKYFEDNKNGLYKELYLKGQSPNVMVIGCSDSRVDPSTLFNCAPGELFVVRNVANLVPPCDNTPRHHGTSAALEFAVQTLKIKHIIVLGHSQCGGIRALLESPDISKENSFIASWMHMVDSAKEKTLQQYQNQPYEQQEKICEEESLLISLKNLHTFPWIEDKVKTNCLSLHAWRFDLSTGLIDEYNDQSGEFEGLI